MYIVRRVVTILFIILFIFSCKKTPTSSEPTDVTFSDANFETLIREVLNKPSGDITPDDLLTITELDGEDRDISDVSGIEYCTNLQKLNLMSNKIIEVSDLGTLTNLQELLLTSNDIIDISALGALTNLTWLSLMDNHIINISALNTLTNLQELALLKNQIVDISALSTLTNLTWLSLGWNNISDISGLSTVTLLRWLGLDINQIADIYPLIQNSGIGNGDTVNLSDNPLNDTTINTYIPQLETRGVNVQY
jgi:Leucine-rich repeat (LRR) protein